MVDPCEAQSQDCQGKHRPAPLAAAAVLAMLLAGAVLATACCQGALGGGVEGHIRGGAVAEETQATSRRLKDEAALKMMEVLMDYDANGTRGVISVSKGQWVHYHAKYGDKGGWVFVTEIIPPKEGQKGGKAVSEYGESGYVPQWVLGNATAVGKSGKSGTGKREAEKETKKPPRQLLMMTSEEKQVGGTRLLKEKKDGKEKTRNFSKEMVPIIMDYAANGTKGTITVQVGEWVYHYGKFDQKKGWTYVTQVIPGKKGNASSVGKSGYVPDWCLGNSTATDGGSKASSAEKKEDRLL